MRTIPRKLSELGRIRIGDQEDLGGEKGRRPRKLEFYRLTSANKPLLHFAASIYGGDVQEWADAPNGGQWELYTAANTLNVLIPTLSACSVQYETWSRGGCTLRCTGDLITHSAKKEQIATACVCPEDDQERAELAKTGKACLRVLRLNVMLPDLPGGLGVWRLETKGFYATAYLLGTLETLQKTGMDNKVIEADLRLEQRSVKREGKTLRFNVPILSPKLTPRQLLAGSPYALLEAPETATTNAATVLFDVDPIDEARKTATGKAIDGMLERSGFDEARQRHVWESWQENYGALTEAVLMPLYERMQASAARKREEQQKTQPAGQLGASVRMQIEAILASRGSDAQGIETFFDLKAEELGTFNIDLSIEQLETILRELRG